MSGIIGDNVGRSSGLVKSAAVTQNLEKLGQGTFSTVSTVSINGLSTYFGSTPTDYRMHLILFDFANTNNCTLFVRQMTSDGVESGSLYSSSSMRNNSNNAGPHINLIHAGSSMRVNGDGLLVGGLHSFPFYFTNVFGGTDDTYLQVYATCSLANNDGSGEHNHRTLFGGSTHGDDPLNSNRTGIHFYVDSGTITGTWRIWGFKQ